jgi:hypothetical protein
MHSHFTLSHNLAGNSGRQSPPNLLSNMPTDTKSTTVLSNKIARLPKEFADSFYKKKELQQQIVIAAEKLAIATREPDENLYHDATQLRF